MKIDNIFGTYAQKVVSCEYEVPPKMSIPQSIVEGGRINLDRATRTDAVVQVLRCIIYASACGKADRQYWSDRVDAWMAVVCAEVNASALMQLAAPSIIQSKEIN